jgi:hypothetical protein
MSGRVGIEALATYLPEWTIGREDQPHLDHLSYAVKAAREGGPSEAEDPMAAMMRALELQPEQLEALLHGPRQLRALRSPDAVERLGERVLERPYTGGHRLHHRDELWRPLCGAGSRRASA